MSDIFNRRTEYGGSFASDSAAFTFSTNNEQLGTGLLVQNLQVNYTQQISRLFDITDTAKTYFVAGRTGGQLNMGRVLGPKAINTAFISQFGDACNLDQNVARLSGRSGCGSTASGQAFSVTVNNCLINNFGINIASQDMVINEAISMMFISLELN